MEEGYKLTSVWLFLLIQTLLVSHLVLCQFCPEDLPRGDAVNLTVDCSQSYSPVVTYNKLPSVTAVLSLEYQCTDGILGIRLNKTKLSHLTILSTASIAVPEVLTGGTNCSFYGCYDHGNLGFFNIRQPVSCTVDVDECVLGLHMCDNSASECIDTIGNYTCSCRDGYEGDGFNCSDINECDLDPPICSKNSHCINTDGNYTCECQPGYEGDGFNYCWDIDECGDTHLNNCSENAVCTNTVENYTCQCDPGFEGDGFNCQDVDECNNTQLNSCSENAICSNTVGSYTCHCDPGFVGDGINCQDVDECDVAQLNSCSENAICSNTVGSYTCQCNEGYVGNGSSCEIDPSRTGSSDNSSSITLISGLTGGLAVVMLVVALTVLASVVWIMRRRKHTSDDQTIKAASQCTKTFDGTYVYDVSNCQGDIPVLVCQELSCTASHAAVKEDSSEDKAAIAILLALRTGSVYYPPPQYCNNPHAVSIRIMYGSITTCQETFDITSGGRIYSGPLHCRNILSKQDEVKLFGPLGALQIALSPRHPAPLSKKLFGFMRRGLLLEANDEGIYATLLGRLVVHYGHSPLKCSGTLPKEERTRVFSYSSRFLSELKGSSEGHGPPPKPYTIFSLGQPWGTERPLSKNLITIVVTHCKALNDLHAQNIPIHDELLFKAQESKDIQIISPTAGDLEAEEFLNP